MSDIYDGDNLDVVQASEVTPSGPVLFAPDAHRLAGLQVTHHHDGDYGRPDTTVTIAEDSSGASVSCSHGGRSYLSGEAAVVPAAVARHWVRSGWATTESDPESEPDESTPVGPQESKAKPPTRAPTRGTAAGSGRRTAKLLDPLRTG